MIYIECVYDSVKLPCYQFCCILQKWFFGFELLFFLVCSSYTLSCLWLTLNRHFIAGDLPISVLILVKLKVALTFYAFSRTLL